MADGMDCTCAAWSENECCCGADWTTQEVYDLRSCVEELERQRDELLAALNRLYVACPTTLECRHFHHSKREHHSYIEPCGPANEYIEALHGASDVIKAAKEQGK